MKKFTCVADIGDLKAALAEAAEIKKDRFAFTELGRNKTLYPEGGDEPRHERDGSRRESGCVEAGD